MVEVAGSVGGVLSPVLQVAQWLAAPIWRPFKYLYNYTTNFKNLEREVSKLTDTRDDVERQIIAAERNVEVIYQTVKKWQDSAQEMIDKAEQLIREKEQFIQEKANNPRCFKGLCSNVIIHYKQSRKAFKLKRDDIDPLLQQKLDHPLLQQKLDPISFQTDPPEIWLESGENYLDFETRNSTVKNVWDALNDENVFMIGVYGMGGLGKTTLVEEIGRKAGRKAEKDKLFDDIAFVEVSKSPDVKKIQTTIASKLGLKFENENENESKMANKLYSRMKGKKILLILDNIWEPLQLERTIGIPCGADRGRNKLLFTTRNEDVLKTMGSTKNFGMGFLNEDEAWALFTKMTGNDIQTHELCSLAKDICKECNGLPIIICAIAKTLKNKRSKSRWRVVLKELKEPSPTEFSRFLEAEHENIALSYKYLKDELKEIFLISSLMENNASISDLLRHVLCLNIFKRANLTMEDARDRLDVLICELKDACLLLNGFTSGQFAMHDVIRDVAITIAYVHHHVLTIRNDIEWDRKERDKLKKCTKIFLPNGNTIIGQLRPNDWDCPNLKYFSMSCTWNSSFKIPNELFRKMRKLKVLNLVGLKQSSLPSSIDFLANLQTLCLNYSNVEDFAIIGRLNKLKILSLRFSNIKEFPTNMGHLTQLRLLDLSYCSQLKVVAPNVLSSLSQLEELYLMGWSIQWKIEVFKELKLLSKLTSLELDIKDDKVLPKDFFSRKFIRYKISVGNWQYRYQKIYGQEWLRILELIINPTINLEELDGIKNVENLCLAEYLDDKGKDDLERSKFFLQSNGVTPLFNKKVIFPDLLVLVLKNIISRKIWDSQLPFTSFQNLKELILWRCTKIKFVFPYTITKNLQQLQYLEIKDCIDLEEIVAIEEITEAAASFVFPEVTFLKLENLPKLATFYPGIHTLEWPKLEKLAVKDSDKFNMFNSEQNSLCLDHKINSDLEKFKLKAQSMVISWNRENKALKISSDESAYNPLPLFHRFQSLEELKLYDCEYKEIKSLFDLPNLNVLHVEQCSKLVSLVPSSPSMARSLERLKELNISDCGMLAEILENKRDVTTIEIVFQKLTKLSLDRLESLTCFCSGNHSLNFPSLEKLIITECPNMNTFFKEIPNVSEFTLQSKEITPFFNKKVHFCDLKVLELKNISSEKIWDSQLSTSPYQNLTHLTLFYCNKIKYVFPLSIAKSLQQLQYLELTSCKVLERIVAPEEGTEAAINFFFPQVSTVKLQYLPEFTDFYPGIYTPEWPKLRELVVKDCPKFKMSTSEPNILCFDQKVHFRDLEVLKLENISSEKIWDSQLSTSSYQNLTHLTLCECDKIKYVFPLSIAKSHQQLQYLELKCCKVLERIVAPEEGTEVAINFFFPQVSTVKLQYLPEFTDFYPGIHTSEWPKLKELRIDYCGKFKMLTSEPNFLCFDQKINHDLDIFEVRDGFEEISWISHFKTLDISFLKLAHIPLCFLQRFENLTRLCVCYCNELVNLTTPSTARSLVQLRELNISNCKMLMEILEIEEDATTEIVFENLNKLSFEWMENLTCFCSGNYTFNFHSLEELNITECPNIKTFCRGILSTPKLQEISYEGVKVKNEGNDLNKTIQELYKQKNQDISLDLNLKCKAFHHDNSMEIVYNQHPTSFYQNLTHLFLWKCGNIKYAFPSSIAKILHQLQQLKIQNCKALEEIVAKEDGANAVVDFVFPNITSLKFEDLPELIAFYPGSYALEMPKLKELVVKDCTKYASLKENNVETELNILAPKSIFLDNKINHDLEVFQVNDGWGQITWRSQSKKLKISYKSVHIPLWLLQRFENLVCLSLSWCKLVNLTRPLIAKSLVQLRKLKISNCEMLVEILEIEEDATIEIVFENLSKLSFDSIESLICFCSGNYTLNFPSLEELNITKCPNMKTFCRGILSTPKLQKINYERMEVENEGNDLNKTIQELYKQKNQDISFDLNLKCKAFHHDNSMEIGYNQHPSSFYQNLTHLFLWKCGNIKYAFPSSIAKSLHQLQQLKIQNCKVLEEIIAKEDGANAVVNFVFPNITLLAIEDLPELIAFYPGVYALEMPKLKELVVQDCTKYVNLKENNMETELNILDPKSNFLDNKINFSLELFELHDGEKEICWQSQSKTLRIIDYNSANISLRLLQRFENVRELQLSLSQYEDTKSRCDLPNLEILIVDYCHKLMSLVPFSTSFQNLKVLDVSFCNGLLKLITPSMARSLVQLRELSITFCEMLIEIVENEGDATIITEIVFNNLNKLSLKWLDSLTSFCSGNYSFSFPSLKELIIKNCPDLEIFCQGSICTSKLDKVICNFEDGNGNVNEVEIRDNDLNTTIQEEHQKQEWEKKMKKKAALDVLQGKSFLQWSPFE